jgi:hypothetical protein
MIEPTKKVLIAPIADAPPPEAGPHRATSW